MVEFTLKGIMTAFVVIILGVVFLGVIADNQVANTELSGATNESITLTSGLGTTNNADITSLDFFGNATHNTVNGKFIRGISINFTKATGAISANTTGDVYNISYGYEGELYVVDTKSHAFLNLNALLFALVLIAAGIMAIKANSDDLSFGFGRG